MFRILKQVFSKGIKMFLNSTATKIYCSKCDKEYKLTEILNLCECGGPLLLDYDFQKAKDTFTLDSLSKRVNNIWRYSEILPVQNDRNRLSLGEGMTPLFKSENIAAQMKLNNLYIKDESNNPTGSFKARGLSMAVSKAKELGIEKIIIPTAGNAGSATAAYCAIAGIKCKIVMPESTPAPFKVDAKYFGAEIVEVGGSIKDAGEKAAELVKAEGWFAVSTLKEPYRIEGKKTMGYELFEQFNHKLPDVIIYPTGGGTGLIGMWKAFNELEKMGLVGSHRPKMISVQTEGCAPIVKAFENKAKSATLWDNPTTLASGLRVPSAVGDFLILDAVYKSNGCAVAVSEDELVESTFELGRSEGIFAAPEGGAALAACKKLVKSGYIKEDDKVVVFNTGSGYKYLDSLAKFI